jgi:hypothetical protein
MDGPDGVRGAVAGAVVDHDHRRATGDVEPGQ